MRLGIAAVAMVLGLLQAVQAEDGGKLSWKGQSGDPKAAILEAKQQGRPLMLYFTSDG